MSYVVLVADDEPGVRQLLEVNLSVEGFEVVIAKDGREVIDYMNESSVDLILLDIMMPRMGGLEVLKILRGNERTASVPVIVISARALTASEMMAAGADDYVVKPFNPIELIARIRNVIFRNAQLRDSNPLTGLPGNGAILRDLQRRIDRREDFAFLYVDIDNFKSLNDKYGFVRGDRAINMLATILRDASQIYPDSFVGHIGGDDFAVICDVDQALTLANFALAKFGEVSPFMYDDDDRFAGSIEVEDRRGTRRKFPLMTLSIGIASTLRREFNNAGEVSHVAAEMKAVAKRQLGNTYSFDRRQESQSLA